jgi:hypothetical protein
MTSKRNDAGTPDYTDEEFRIKLIGMRNKAADWFDNCLTEQSGKGICNAKGSLHDLMTIIERHDLMCASKGPNDMNVTITFAKKPGTAKQDQSSTN